MELFFQIEMTVYENAKVLNTFFFWNDVSTLVLHRQSSHYIQRDVTIFNFSQQEIFGPGTAPSRTSFAR